MAAQMGIRNSARPGDKINAVISHVEPAGAPADLCNLATAFFGALTDELKEQVLDHLQIEPFPMDFYSNLGRFNQIKEDTLKAEKTLKTLTGIALKASRVEPNRHCNGGTTPIAGRAFAGFPPTGFQTFQAIPGQAGNVQMGSQIVPKANSVAVPDGNNRTVLIPKSIAASLQHLHTQSTSSNASFV